MNCLPLLGRKEVEPDGVLAPETDSLMLLLAVKAEPTPPPCGGEKGEEPWEPPESTMSCPSPPAAPNPMRLLSLEEPEKI